MTKTKMNGRDGLKAGSMRRSWKDTIIHLPWSGVLQLWQEVLPGGFEAPQLWQTLFISLMSIILMAGLSISRTSLLNSSITSASDIPRLCRIFIFFAMSAPALAYAP